MPPDNRTLSSNKKREPMDVHAWFGLTYANYLVVPRAVLQSMPDEWQHRFTVLMDEMQDRFDHLDWPSYDVRVLKREPELQWMPESCAECGGEGRIDLNAGWHGPPSVERHNWHPCPRCDSTGDDPENGDHRYETPQEVGFRRDPIPDYNRGRTKLEAQSGASD